MALLPVKPGVFYKGKKVASVKDGSKVKPKGRAKAKPKSEVQTSSATPATATDGGGKGGLPSSPRSSTPSTGGNNLPVSKSSKPPRAPRSGIGQGGRQEKFMGNAQRVPNDALPGLGAKGKRKGAGKAVLAGGAAAGAAALYGSREDKPAQTVTPASVKPPMAASTSSPSVNLRKPPTGGASGSMGGATTTPAPKSTPKAASSGRRGAGKNESMADYLGLSKDSAVRTYMETGKHKYEPKYPASTGQKAGTVTKAAKRTQKTR